jgi:hypothetical protein
MDNTHGGQKVEITVPLTVVNALLTPNSKELDLGAGIRALSHAGTGFLVSVHDAEQNVRIWVDAEDASN